MAEESFSKRAAKQRDIAILRSLLTCFNEHGCFETTLDQVAAEVGVGKGTLYRHYESREDLFEAALQVGIEALIVRCHQIWEAHAPDFDAALRALIGELVSLNHQGDALSPSTLARLGCGCRWLSPRHRRDERLGVAFIPVVQGWQAVGLVERTTDASWIATVTIALVNSLAVARQASRQLVESSVISTGTHQRADDTDIATRIVDVLRRAFAPTSQSTTAVVGL